MQYVYLKKVITRLNAYETLVNTLPNVYFGDLYFRITEDKKILLIIKIYL